MDSAIACAYLMFDESLGRRRRPLGCGLASFIDGGYNLRELHCGGLGGQDPAGDQLDSSDSEKQINASFAEGVGGRHR